jgi:serine/threonine protein kinase
MAPNPSMSSHERFEANPAKPYDQLTLTAQSGTPTPGATEYSAGTVIAEQYEVLSSLGSGGMSHVYKCRDLTLNRFVAVKTLKVDSNSNPLSAARFQREGKAIALLEHENIVKVYNLQFTAAGQPFLVMEIVHGTPLANLIRSEAAMPVHRVLKFISQICDALAEAHKQGVIHRDLKPNNIMVVNPGRPDEKIKLLDFGIAKLANDRSTESTQTGEIFGSPAYMSPEQALGKKVDTRTDQYSLGCVAFELLTGRLPFLGESPLKVMMDHVQSDAPSLSQVAKRSFPANVERTVSRLLSKDPDDRFDNIGQTKQAFMGNGPVGRPMGNFFLSQTFSLWLWATTVVIAGIVFATMYLHTQKLWESNEQISLATEDLKERHEPVEIDVRGAMDDQNFTNQVKAQAPTNKVEIEDVQHLSLMALRTFQTYPFVNNIHLKDCSIDDYGLAYLANTLPLEILQVDHCTDITDIGVKALSQSGKMKALYWLNLACTNITNDGVASLEKLPRLTCLMVNETKVSCAGVQSLRDLNTLDLNGTEAGKDLAKLCSLRLTYLSVARNHIKDRDLNALIRIRTLSNLDLQGNEITDKGLMKLANLPNLNRLNVCQCPIRPEAISRFKKLKPHCLVTVVSSTQISRTRVSSFFN